MNSDFLRLYRSLFHGREDLYAYRREKEKKSGYYPTYQFNRNTFRKHQAKGRNLANFEEKTLDPLTDSVIIRHLKGKGFGNLIALPLQGKSLQEGNSAFLDPQTFIPYSDQRSFLHTIKRLTTSHFNQIFSSFSFEDLNDEVTNETKEKKVGQTTKNPGNQEGNLKNNNRNNNKRQNISSKIRTSTDGHLIFIGESQNSQYRLSHQKENEEKYLFYREIF